VTPPPDRRPLRVLYVKDKFHWPRSSGGDIHGSQMARALAARGHVVDIATFAPSDPPAVEGLGMRRVIDLSAQKPAPEVVVPPTALQRRYERYLGVDLTQPPKLAGAVQAGGYDAVVVLGVNSIPLLRAVRGPVRVWHAADDAALLHWSMFRPFRRRTWMSFQLAVVQGVYERAYQRTVDRGWVVSERDRRAMRRIGGFAAVDVIPNGVDADFFAPLPETVEEPNSCAFWGHLEFGPNADAIDWFTRGVWPLVRARVPTARFTVIGFKPTDRVRRACAADGVELLADVPDLRATVCGRTVAVMPFVSGVGIKNKVLEAAALGRAMVCTPTGTSGLRGAFPATVTESPAAFAEAVVALLGDPAARVAAGRAAREWVTREHGWAAAAALAEVGLYQSLARRPAGRASSPGSAS